MSWTCFRRRNTSDTGSTARSTQVLPIRRPNSSTQYKIRPEAQYPRERWSASGSFTSNLTGNTGATTSTRNQIAGYYHLMRGEQLVLHRGGGFSAKLGAEHRPAVEYRWRHRPLLEQHELCHHRRVRRTSLPGLEVYRNRYSPARSEHDRRPSCCRCGTLQIQQDQSDREGLGFPGA